MKPLALVLAVLALAAAGCGGGDEPTVAAPPESPAEPAGGGVAASCIAGFNWNGRFYARDAGELDAPFEIDAELGRGVQPACNDMGQNIEPDQDVTVLRIKGVDPEIAVAREGDDRPYFNLMPATER
jgi:hypothetical protein